MAKDLQNISTYYPRDPLLAKCIQYYYFMRSDPGFSTAYFVFPNTNISITIHKDINYVIGNHSITVSGSQNNNQVILVQGIRELPVFVSLAGELDKLTIAFHPLGLNHFIRDTYLDVAAKETQLCSTWDNNEQYNTFIKAFYLTHDHDQRISLLEEFLLSVYSPVKDLDILTTGIQQLCDFNEEKKISEIAGIIGIPERTFNRMFLREVGISPAKFKKIARFRHSLNNKLFNRQLQRLTEIGYASNFYDQAYFINIYKQLTKKNPKAFFREIDQLADNNLILSFTTPG